MPIDLTAIRQAHAAGHVPRHTHRTMLLAEVDRLVAENERLSKRAALLESVQRDYDRVTNLLPWPAKKLVIDAHPMAHNGATDAELSAHLSALGVSDG